MMHVHEWIQHLMHVFYTWLFSYTTVSIWNIYTALWCTQLFMYTSASSWMMYIIKIICLFCKRALQKRRYSAKKTCNFIDPTDRSHPIALHVQKSLELNDVHSSIMHTALFEYNGPAQLSCAIATIIRIVYKCHNPMEWTQVPLSHAYEPYIIHVSG